MSMLIILVGTLAQLRIGVGCMTFPGMGPRRGQYESLCQNSEFCTCLHFPQLISILGCSASYFLEMVMPVR